MIFAAPTGIDGDDICDEMATFVAILMSQKTPGALSIITPCNLRLLDVEVMADCFGAIDITFSAAALAMPRFQEVYRRRYWGRGVGPGLPLLEMIARILS